MTGFAIHRSIQLTCGRVAWVDQSDFEMLSHWTWSWSSVGNRATAYNGGGYAAKRTVLMHRVIMLPDPGQEVDHINGDTLDNRRANLRACSRRENSWNLHKARGSSEFRGVSWKKDRSQWLAVLFHAGKQCHIGYFSTETEAARAYDAATLRLRGEFANPNLVWPAP